MILGLLLACSSPVDARSCQAVPYDKKYFSSMQECQGEMKEAAIYTASAFNLVTRPYCFKIRTNV